VEPVESDVIPRRWELPKLLKMSEDELGYVPSQIIDLHICRLSDQLDSWPWTTGYIDDLLPHTLAVLMFLDSEWERYEDGKPLVDPAFQAQMDSLVGGIPHTHNWVEVEDVEPPYDICNSCGATRR
jgi:hypothetical protein